MKSLPLILLAFWIYCSDGSKFLVKEAVGFVKVTVEKKNYIGFFTKEGKPLGVIEEKEVKGVMYVEDVKEI